MQQPPTPLRLSAVRQELLGAPVGKAHASSSFLYFRASERLTGFVIWGHPTRADVEDLVALLRTELTGPPHAWLLDLGRLEGGDPAAFDVFERYLSEHADVLARTVSHAAVVRPTGLLGTLTAGFFGAPSCPYPTTLFTERAAAIVSLDADVVELDAALKAIEASAADTAVLVRRVREVITADLVGATLATTAAALRLSGRSLQRRLAEHGTSFQAEVNRARLRKARLLLRDTDVKVAHVAFETGYSSATSLSNVFRREVGESPSAWRRRARLTPALDA